MGRSPSFLDLVQGLEDYAEKEGLEVFQVLNELTEHFIPGIEEIATETLLIMEDHEIH
jgi:hypothetical protein